MSSDIEFTVGRLCAVIIGCLWMWLAVDPATPVVNIWGAVLLRAVLAFCGASLIIMGVLAQSFLRS